ncbi:MAG: hypothetical protein PHF86_07360 [Candidatus Nanoarchaeia archaeon]|jgi:hypothetical protein|nr:hypothetical protein [Candidatus Nanoarchaeia archaeon]
MDIKKITDDILKKASYITDTRKKINKLKEILITISDLLEDLDESDVKKINDHLDHGTNYIKEIIDKAIK